MASPDRPRALDEQRSAWYRKACDQVEPARLAEIAAGMVSIPSPPGGEAPLARHLAERGAAAGLDATVQYLDDDQANAVCTLAGSGDGPALLLYAPIDTHATGRPESDCPQVAEQLRPDMMPEARVEGDFVLGLGANNPKGHAACILAAVEAVQRAGVGLTGTVLAGFGAGGMPTNAPDGAAGRRNVGHGVGCSYMIEQGVTADFAVIPKTGWSVSWEEVGLAWIRVRTHGRHNYVGIRHFTPYQNPIVTMADVIGELERWFAGYSARHSGGLVAPQGSIGAIQGGWPHSPAFNPAACDLLLDLRLSPRTRPLEAFREVQDLLRDVSQRREGVDVTCELVTAVPGTSTDPDSWIVGSMIRAWEDVTGQEHEARGNASGATDANILRSRGIPTARLGMPPLPDHTPVPADFSRGMNVAHVPDMERLTRALIYAVVDTCTRTRDEVAA